MALRPRIRKKSNFAFKQCEKCGGTFGSDNFCQSNSYFFKDGVLPYCNTCLTDFLRESNFDWRAVDKICQWADIPFVPKEWEKLREMGGDEHVFATYCAIFQGDEYISLGWDDYYQQFLLLKERDLIEDELPLIKDEKFRKLKEKWGANYDDEDLLYLENLYKGILATQNVNGALQIKQAQQLCMISLELESRIRAGSDFDKLLTSYDKLVKVAEFTPKNTKNASDFDSTGELFHWLEKRGWKNSFYDNVTRDIVDETMKNIENFNQRLYVNETGIGEEISRRIEQLKMVNEQENYYDTNREYNLEEFDNSGYDELIKQNIFEAEI